MQAEQLSKLEELDKEGSPKQQKRGRQGAPQWLLAPAGAWHQCKSTYKLCNSCALNAEQQGWCMANVTDFEQPQRLALKRNVRAIMATEQQTANIKDLRHLKWLTTASTIKSYPVLPSGEAFF